MSSSDCINPIIHVLVVGFHHKKGCVVEYAYPSLTEIDDSGKCGELPDLWKHLPTLALPDGAHNYEEDTIYFHLPSLENSQQTVFGISCYRQINAQILLRRSSDITRETVQKSVCVISKIPLYGLIQAKLELITHAYFDERDFSKVSLLEETFKNLNSSLPTDLSDSQQTFLGLSIRDFILRFKHKTLLLFKLLLLEKRVLFYKAPVKDLCSAVLTLCSLVPGMIESGLNESVTSYSSRKNTPLLTFTNQEDYLEVSFKENNNQLQTEANCDAGHCLNESSTLHTTNSHENRQSKVTTSTTVPDQGESINSMKSINDAEQNISRPKTLQTRKQGLGESDASSINSSDTEGDSWVKINHVTPEIASSGTSVTSSGTEMKTEDRMRAFHELLEDDEKIDHSTLRFKDDSEEKNDSKSSQNVVNGGLSSLISSLRSSKSSSLQTSKTDDANSRLGGQQSGDQIDQNKVFVNVSDIESDECGLPLCIFKKGMLCHPYLSLPYLEVLNDLSVRGFIVGATNILFKQKKHLFDVIIEVEDGKIEILDPELKKQLSLTTEDLRFADHLVRHVMEDRQDVFLDGTGWEGGDEWLRSQFKLYLLSVMRTSEIEVSGKEGESFNLNFMNAWKSTHNYKIWTCSNHLGILDMNPGHPFHGQLSMADMKLKFSHTMQNTERGRRINTAVQNTGKAVVQTGKAVGGAFTSAKSVVSSWWTNFNVPPQSDGQTDEEEKEKPAQETKVQQHESEGLM